MCKVIERRPCHGRVLVTTGTPASDIPRSQDHSVGLWWVAQCGKVVLCENCTALVNEVGSAFECCAVSDVVARHLSSMIRSVVLKQEPLDGCASWQLLTEQLST